MLVHQEMANSSQGGTNMSHRVHEIEEVAETKWTHENVVVEQEVEEESQHVVHEQP
jgi:hypothetical protein